MEPLRLTFRNMGLVWQETAAAINILRKEAGQAGHTHIHWDTQNTVTDDFQGDYGLLRTAALAFYGTSYKMEFPEAPAIDRNGISRREIVFDFTSARPVKPT